MLVIYILSVKMYWFREKWYNMRMDVEKKALRVHFNKSKLIIGEIIIIIIVETERHPSNSDFFCTLGKLLSNAVLCMTCKPRIHEKCVY